MKANKELEHEVKVQAEQVLKEKQENKVQSEVQVKRKLQEIKSKV